MEIKALHLVELQYERTIQKILPYFYQDLNKNQQIRVRQWIKKLSSVINNLLWKKNRNLYAKLLHAMLEIKSGLLQPFNKTPPQNSLPKLSIYDIPYNLRMCIENNQKQQKKNALNKNQLLNQNFCKQNNSLASNIHLNNQAINHKNTSQNSSKNTLCFEQQVQKINLIVDESLQFLLKNYQNILICEQQSKRSKQRNSQMQQLKQIVKQIKIFKQKANID